MNTKVKVVIILNALSLSLVFLGFITPKVFYINFTPSCPVGIYLAIPGSLERGDFVVLKSEFVNSPFKLPDNLVKHFEGLPGDRVVCNQNGIWLNGEFCGSMVSHLKPFVYDGLVPQDSAFLLTSASRSYDSRYFGFINIKYLTKVIPLWTFA